MQYQLKIAEYSPEGVSTLSLLQVLESLEFHGRQLSWKMLELEGVAVQGSDLDVLALEKQVEVEQGVDFSWNALKELAQELFDVYDLSLVGLEPSSSIAGLRVNCLDSNAWEIASDDIDLLHRLKNELGGSIEPCPGS